MQILDLTSIMNIAYRSKYNLRNIAEAYGHPVACTLHWTADTYFSYYNDYHILIDGDGDYHVTTDDFSIVKSHNWMKNSGNIGIALCCAYGADSNSLGYYPPTQVQIIALEKLVAVLSEALDIEIDKVHFPTHGESADNEDWTYYYPSYTGYINNIYGPKSTCERWDLEFLGTSDSPEFNPYDEEHRGGNVIRKAALKYRMSFYGH